MCFRPMWLVVLGLGVGWGDKILFTSLLENADEIQFKMSIVSTIIHDSDYLWDDDEYEDENSEGSESKNTER